MSTDPRYECTPLRQITGNLLRPGGPELTVHGLDLCAFRSGARLLDLGCGPGASLSLLAERGFSCYGLDHSAALLREAKAHAPCLLADFSRIPLADKCLNGIVCECVLSLAANKAAVLDECRRVLRPGGKLLLSDLVLRPAAGRDRAGAGAQPDSLTVPGVPCALGALLPDDLLSLLHDRGFSISHCEDQTRLLWNLAAQIVWRFGSIAAFAGLWHTGPVPSQECSMCPPAPKGTASPFATGDNVFGYLLIIAEKTGDIP